MNVQCTNVNGIDVLHSNLIWFPKKISYLKLKPLFVSEICFNQELSQITH